MQGGVRSYAEKSFASGKHSGVPMPVKVDTPNGTPSVPQMVFNSLKWPANEMQSLPSLELRVEPKAELKAKPIAESKAELKAILLKVPTYLMPGCRTCPTFGQGVWMRVDRLLTDKQNFSWTNVKIYLEINKFNCSKNN